MNFMPHRTERQEANSTLTRSWTAPSVLAASCSVFCSMMQAQYRGWEVAGGTAEDMHYSSLRQINSDNVKDLKVAWTFDSGDAYPGSGIECNPIVVNGVLYTTTPKLHVVALDAATGRQIWMFDPLSGGRPTHKNRGLSYWTDGKEARIFHQVEHELMAIDTKTGKLDKAFGDNGKVDLRTAYDRPASEIVLTVRSPGIVYKDLLILGSTVSEWIPSAPGDIRAYDVRSGKLRWTFHTIPHPGESGYDTWPPEAWKTSGGANDWAGMALDEKRGTVFVPTGAAAFDFFGPDRHGDNLFANSILCLDAATGKLKWHFQTVKHDVWDMDLPSAPVLVTVRREGKLVDAVAQASKDGYVYVVNRETGESLFPMKEIAAPASQVEGELLSTTQRIPLKPAPFSRQEFTESTVTTRTPAAHEAVLSQLKELKHGGRFLPPTTTGTLVFPGFAGGAEWGAGAFDPESHLYYVNSNDIAYVLKLVPPEPLQNKTTAGTIFKSRCSGCHGVDRKGGPAGFPALDHLEGRLNAEQIAAIVTKGTGRMPSFASLGEPAVQALAQFLITNNDVPTTFEQKIKFSKTLKYTNNGYQQFTDPDGYPASTPPWGSLSAINLDTGDYAWKIPLGEYPELVAKGLKDTGSENHGGGVVTAGGLFFIGATHYDSKFRAFDKRTGQLLWETVLPYAGIATPAVYEVNGKEYVVIAAGGGSSKPSGSTFVAFALP
jgi:quinoprotein glucose dehydrogenase